MKKPLMECGTLAIDHCSLSSGAMNPLLEFREGKNVIYVYLGDNLDWGIRSGLAQGHTAFWDRANTRIMILGTSILFSINISQSQFTYQNLELASI